MASSPPRGELPSLLGQSDSDSPEPLHKHPALQRSTVPPRPPVINPQAVLKRRVKREEPSLLHSQVREQMNRFPGWYTEPAPPIPKDQEQRLRKPVHLPPLPSTKNATDQQCSKKVVLTPPLQRPPFSIKRCPQLAPTSQTQLYEYSSTEFIMIDNKAVISVCEEDTEFLSLERWEKFSEIRRKLLCIPFFARYKMWKPFYVWRTNVRAKKISLAKGSLQNSLFILNPSLSPALMDIRKMCCQITETGFCHMKKKHTYTLQEFQDTKIKQLQEASSDLEKFHELVKEVTVCACDHYLLDAKAHLDDKKKIISGINMPFFFNRVSQWMEVTRFESLEQLMSMFKLAQLLWDSLEQWDSLQSGWQQSTLQQLDMEQFTSQVNKYSKYVSQLEKGLPRNSGVPRLKEKVEAMMHRLPVITDLRNPCMKPEHWKTVESLVGTSLNVDKLTVAA